MKNRIVNVPSVQDPIKSSPGFDKKGLSDFKLDLMGLCGFGCAYCSSNEGNYLRIRRKKFLDLTEEQLGDRVLPSEDPSLTFVWPDILARLKSQLDRKGDGWGAGHTLVFSMLTDAFSPMALKDGVTEAALRMVLERTRFRIRVLTKNAAVGSPEWIRLFKSYPDRFVVGLSIGSLDDAWARRIEVGTSLPSARLKALTRLQDAGVPTFGMACPIFPDVLEVGALDKLIDRMRPDLVEDFWAEPFNNRTNWQVVRHGYEPGSAGYKWFTDVFEHRNLDRWSEYATDLYVRLLARARDGGWGHKLRYLLYEEDIVERDAPQFAGLEGVMLQSKPAAGGRSANPFIARLQQATGPASSRPSEADLQERPRRRLPVLTEHPAEGSRNEPAVQDRHHADGQQVPVAPKSVEHVGIAAEGDSFDGLTSGNGSNAFRATREKAAITTPSSNRRTMGRKPKESQMKGQRKNAAKSMPRVRRQKRGEVREIRLADIVVPKHRARRLRDVTSLIESIERSGLIEPIVVRRLLNRRLVLVAGAHRLEAHRQLGRTTILAKIVKVSDLEAELIELDENLTRIELTVLERGEHLLRRKQIYEQLHPEVKRGGAPGKKGGGKKAKDATVASFAENTSVMTGLSIRTIQDDVKIARLPAEARQVIRGTPIEDQKRVLLQITRIAPDKQAAVAEAVASGRCRTVSQAAIELGVNAKRPARPRCGDIAGRMRQVAEPIQKAGKRWERIVQGMAPALVQQAQEVSVALKMLEEKIAALMRSAAESAEPVDKLPHVQRPTAAMPTATVPSAATLGSAEVILQNAEWAAEIVSRRRDRLMTYQEFEAVRARLSRIQPALKASYKAYAPTRTTNKLHGMICDAVDRFVDHHGREIVSGSYNYAHYLMANCGDIATYRAAMQTAGEEILAYVRALNARIPVLERTRTPTARPTNGPGSGTVASAGPTHDSLPSASQPTPQKALPTPQPYAVATSAAAPPKTSWQEPAPEEVEQQVSQIINEFRSGRLRLPFQGQSEILRKNWPAHVREPALKLFFRMFDALQQTKYAAQRSGPSSSVQAATPTAEARPHTDPHVLAECVPVRAAAFAAATPSAVRAGSAPSQEPPARLAAPASPHPPPRMRDLEEKKAFVRAATALRNTSPAPTPVGAPTQTALVSDFAKAIALARAAPLVPGTDPFMPQDALTRAAKLLLANTK